MRARRGVRLAAGAALLLGGCVPTVFVVRPSVVERPLRHAGPSARVLVLPVGVQLGSLTAGGVFEPNAEWTAQALKHVTAALDDVLAGRGVVQVRYEPPERGSAREAEHHRLARLLGAVARAIGDHHYRDWARLPTKKGRLDWTMGPGAARFAEGKDVDYLLLVNFRDSYATGGRTALIVFSSILGGSVPSPGLQSAAAVLVELKSGDVVWCNVLVRTGGELRQPEPARAAVELLLRGFPL